MVPTLVGGGDAAALADADPRALFDDEQWAHVEQEASQPLSPDAVIALGRRLLDEGALAPAAVPTLTETT